MDVQLQVNKATISMTNGKTIEIYDTGYTLVIKPKDDVKINTQEHKVVIE